LQERKGNKNNTNELRCVRYWGGDSDENGNETVAWEEYDVEQYYTRIAGIV
jgi:hypothetical protein